MAGKREGDLTAGENLLVLKMPTQVGNHYTLRATHAAVMLKTFSSIQNTPERKWPHEVMIYERRGGTN